MTLSQMMGGDGPFTLADPFSLELNLKRSSAEADDQKTEEGERKRICTDPTEPEKGFGWEICVYNEESARSQTFHVAEEVGRRFNYFRLLREKSASAPEKSEVPMSYQTARIVFQEGGDSCNEIFRRLTPENFEVVLVTLDYLGFLPMVGQEESNSARGEEIQAVNLFWSTLTRKLSCFDWFGSESSAAGARMRQKVLSMSLRLQNGFKLLLELVQYHQMRDVVVSLEGGRVVREIFKQRSEAYGIRIVNTICESLGAQWSPEVSKVEDFLKGVTGEAHIFDAISCVWQPTLWYLSEHKTIRQFAQSSPHVITGEMNSFPIELELYADQDSEGSTTTVNFAMETLPPSPDAPITSVTSLGIFAYPKTRCTGFFNCFSARARFYFEKVFLGEATFDLSSNGIKAFCPVISGGPNKTGLLVTCRTDEFVEQNKDELQRVLLESSQLDSPPVHNGTLLDQITISNLDVDVKVRFFPLRTLTLYLLHKRSLEIDTRFVTKFAFSLQQDVAEWLGTYFTCVWIQISKQKESLFASRYRSVLSLSSRSLRGCHRGQGGPDSTTKFSENTTPNISTRYSSSASSSSSSTSLDFFSFVEGERSSSEGSRSTQLRPRPRQRPRPRNSSVRTSSLLHDLGHGDSSLPKDSSCFSDLVSGPHSRLGTNGCYIDPMSPSISPFPLITAWFKGVGKPSDSWCVHNILSEVLSEDLISRYFTDVLTLIQTCESWVDAESLANIRQQFIQFMSNNKLDSIGALLFDWIRHIPNPQAHPDLGD